MEKLLISACLIGRAVRWNGTAKAPQNAVAIARWRDQGRLVPVCPELLGGLPTPRPPAEIEPGASAADVWEGRARILEKTGGDVTAAYLTGARAALAAARAGSCRFALLTQASPSCGVGLVHDGTFQGRRVTGDGVTAALLQAEGVTVFSDDRVAELAALPTFR